MTCLSGGANGCKICIGARDGFDRTRPKPVSLNRHAPDLYLRRSQKGRLMNELPQYDPDASGEPITITKNQWRLVNDELGTLIRAHNRLVERIAALEAQTTPEAEVKFVPGWKEFSGRVGMSCPRNDYFDIYFRSILRWDDEPTCCIVMRVDGVESELSHVCEKDLRHLIGAAQAVLKRMEAVQSDGD